MCGRRHNRSRLMLFTPFRVPRGPPREVRFGMRRRTVGKFESGESFKIDGKWNTEETRHKMLDQGWTGYTEFYVDNGHDDNDHEEDRQDPIILRNPYEKGGKNFEDAREKSVRFENIANCGGKSRSHDHGVEEEKTAAARESPTGGPAVVKDF